MKNLDFRLLHLIAILLLLVLLPKQQANAQNLVLENMTITSTATFSASSITAGPNFTVASTGDVILSAATIAIKPRFVVVTGGKLQVVSGVMVSIDPNDPQNPQDPQGPAIPKTFAVAQNYPNPFNPETNISYQLPKTTEVRIEVFNMLGQRIKTLWSGSQVPGRHSLTWKGENNAGQRVSSGTYYYVITTGEKQITKKMTLLK